MGNVSAWNFPRNSFDRLKKLLKYIENSYFSIAGLLWRQPSFLLCIRTFLYLELILSLFTVTSNQCHPNWTFSMAKSFDAHLHMLGNNLVKLLEVWIIENWTFNTLIVSMATVAKMDKSVLIFCIHQLQLMQEEILPSFIKNFSAATCNEKNS